MTSNQARKFIQIRVNYAEIKTRPKSVGESQPMYFKNGKIIVLFVIWCLNLSEHRHIGRSTSQATSKTMAI